jgi:quercetin dioxygenase-like cupin family protein
MEGVMTGFSSVETGKNVTRQVLSDHPDRMAVAFRFAAEGASGVRHNHPHVQSTYVESGRYRFILGDEEREVGPGDSFVIPSDQTHGCVCLKRGALVDCFTPRRDDVL